MPDRSNRTYVENGRNSLDLNQHDGNDGSRDGRRGMQNDAKRAVVGVGVDRVDVRHLNDREQSQQRQTHTRRRRKPGALRGDHCASVCKARSNLSFLEKGL